MNKFKIISFLILSSLSSFSFAGAAEDRTQSIIDKAISTRSYSSATGHDFTVGGVKAANGQVSADISQRVVVDGSSATVKQKVSIPANDAFYKKTAGFAKNLLKGGLYGAAAAAAMSALLEGVDYVMGEGGQITKIPAPADKCLSDGSNCKGASSLYYINANTKVHGFYSTSSQACSTFVASFSTYFPGQGYRVTDSSGTSCRGQQFNLSTPNSWQSANYAVSNKSNTSYIPNYTPAPEVVPDAQIDDAFSNWFKNNPSPVTDPVTTYIYSPKTSTGAAATTPQDNPSFGQQEITDEMMDNYLANRNAELYANDVAANQAAIRDSAQVETESNPDGSKTTTKNNPDGSKTETKTETKTNPDTGVVETTVTETVINPDGTKQPSKVTETKTETKPNPETSKLPAACEYFAVLCDWIGWTKENPDMPEDDPLVPQELDIGSLNTSTFQATAGCPADIQVPVSFGGASKSIAISYEPICALAQKWSFIAPLIGFISGAMILIGVGRKGEDGDS